MSAAALACCSMVTPGWASAQSDIALSPEVYSGRRAALFEQTGGQAIIVPGEYMIRHGGALKQDLDFWYLTGVESPWALLVIAQGTDGQRRDVLFLPDEYQFAGAQYPMVDDRFRGAA